MRRVGRLGAKESGALDAQNNLTLASTISAHGAENVPVILRRSRITNPTPAAGARDIADQEHRARAR
jgi:hypothetical protein